VEQLSKEWFAQRKARITGSIVGAILGISPFADRNDILRAKCREWLGLPSEIDIYTADVVFSYGRALESQAVTAFETEYNMKVEHAPLVVHPRFDWLAASPDGYTSDGNIIEIKCPHKFKNVSDPLWQPLAAQPHYYAQVQIELACTGRKYAHFYQFAPLSLRGWHEIIKYNPVWFADVLPDLEEFYYEYLSVRDDRARWAPSHLDWNIE
jgi:putative phage-type endonuclease